MQLKILYHYREVLSSLIFSSLKYNLILVTCLYEIVCNMCCIFLFKAYTGSAYTIIYLMLTVNSCIAPWHMLTFYNQINKKKKKMFNQVINLNF